MDTLWRVIERNARNFPNQTALRYPPQNLTLTWQSLHSQALGLASTIQSLETDIERIALLSPNKPEFILEFLAAMVLDKAIVPINIRLTVREISDILTDGLISVLLYEESMALLAQELEQLGFTIVNISTETAAAKVISSLHCDGTKAAEILYTSGTTGKPKGVKLSRQAILAAAKLMAYEAEIHSGDNCLILMPLTDSASLNLFLWGAFWSGASVTLGDFTPQTLLAYAAQEKTTHFFGAPVVYQLISRIPNLKDWDLTNT